MRPSAPLLRVRDLAITHREAAHPTPRDVSFDVHAGEVVLLLGPSGSGKSTLTLALNGLIPQSVDAAVSGEVEVAGRRTTDTPVAQLSEDIAMVFQDPDAQLVTGSVLDEVAFALENQLLPVAEVLERAETALRRVGLWDRRSWNPDLLSGGGRQRLAIACALAMGSRVLVLDEPTANLDPQGAADVHGALADLVAEGDRAVILVEHDVEAALPFATRAIALDQQGRTVFDGAPGDLPASVTARRDTSPARMPDGAPAESAITARDLVVTRRGDELLRVGALDVPAGSFTAIVGANGAGKTTLLQALTGVAPPPRGTVRIAGLDAGAASPAQLAGRVGYVFQNPEHQFIAHTVHDELAHGLRLQRVPSEEIDRRVAEVLDRFDLAHKADTHPFLLSGGEKRRLSVGTALIARPQVIALDEPTFGQDPARAAELLTLLRELQGEGTTVVVVTHDLGLVAAHATHLAVLEEGALRAFGPAEDLLSDPVLLTDAGLRPSASGEGSRTAERAGAAQSALRTSTAPTAVDPYAEAPVPARFWLHHINPLGKLLAVLPAMILLLFTRDIATPAAFLVLSYALVLSGARLTRRALLLLFAGVPVGIAVIGLSFSAWVAPALVDHTAAVLRMGDWTLYAGALATGFATALRLAAILGLALVGGLTTTGPDLVRSSVQHLHVPYRVGYTALAAYRFVPRFGHELAVIRAAHRVRGHHGGRGPFARLARGWGYIVPLLAGGIRHAERVALAMDARAFGAHPTRTERHRVPLRARDAFFTAGLLLATAAILIPLFPWQPS
ncbi:energy-coupling factor transporter ATPase [Microbacterium sp.]|uniref:energy-coupling factor transporter ATPase n=1 Tax=Microbacterium sp. TaxID=51671 RepID=UPI00333ECC2C